MVYHRINGIALIASMFALGGLTAHAQSFTPDQLAAIRILAVVDDASVLCPGFSRIPHSENVHAFLARHGLTQEGLVATQIEETLDNLAAAKADPASSPSSPRMPRLGR